ncbi:PA14 domain-containing protein [Verrucomicrobium spinosum]|uniref:PA14 domain-containing protein n=2 Tax=Verrucomicrobium spinosum TaxID=2736 RepID=UPI0018DE2E88|nr:PA14 domain-containing protein [Verrucomicrobium spinosum]
MTDPTTDIQAWLESHGLDELLSPFIENDITVDLLPTLSGEELREMGVTSLGLRKKALAAIAALQSAPPEPAWVPAAEKVHAPAPPVIRVQESISQPKSGASAPPVFLPAPSLPSLPPPSVAAAGPRSAAVLSHDQVVSSSARHAPPPATAASPPKKVKRKLFSASFLVVSIGLHLVLGLGAGYWVVQQIAAKRKLQFSSGPPTSSPSKRALEHKVSLQKRKNAGGAPAQARRISVQGLASNITLPEMPTMATSSTQVVAGRMSGMGGAGFGTGLGFGNGNGMGVGGLGTGGLGLTMFGARGGGGLEGTFYDLKQTKGGRPHTMSPELYNSAVRAWVEGGLKESDMDQYYRAPTKLYATQFVMPDMGAGEAPKAYGVEDHVKPSQWVAHYKGKVSPPKTGTYQFMGAGDDTLVVFFDKKHVLDASWKPVSSLSQASIEPEGAYVGFPRKGYVKGTPFKAVQGQWYDIDILIGEQPGGKFFACLCIEEEKKNGLPLFRLSAGKLPKMNNPPPFEENAPVWKVLGEKSGPLDMLRR